MAGPRRRDKPTGPLDGLAAAATARRHRLGMTQRDLAELAGVGLNSVHSLEAGSDSLTMAVTLRVLDALGLSLAVGPRQQVEHAAGVDAVVTGSGS